MVVVVVLSRILLPVPPPAAQLKVAAQVLRELVTGHQMVILELVTVEGEGEVLPEERVDQQ